MNQSETIKALLESLVNAQAELVTLPKNKQGYGYKYTELDTVISSIKPILAKHHIAFMQSLTTLEGRPAITTRLFNKDGEWIEDTITLPPVEMAKTNAAQNLGAAITYMRRYALCSILGISSDEDTDAATVTPEKKESKPRKVYSEKASWTEEQMKEIGNLLNTTDSEGAGLFSDKDKAAFKKQLTVEGGEKTLAAVKAVLQLKLENKEAEK